MQSNSTALNAPSKEPFSDPFNVKSFSTSAAPTNDEFVSMANDSVGKTSSLNGKQSSIDEASSGAGDTTYFSAMSAEMSLSSIHANNESGLSTIHANNESGLSTIHANDSINSLRTIITRPADLPVKRQVSENPFAQSDDTLESNSLLNSNVEIDPFETNISTLDSLSKSDPFNGRDDFFGNSKLGEDSKSAGQFEASSFCIKTGDKSGDTDKANRSSKMDTEIDFGDDDSRFDAEFEKLPSNVTYLEPDAFEKQFPDESTFEKLDENECAMARRMGGKLANIPEDSRERNSSESEGEFENEFVGPAQPVKHQAEHQTEHSQIERTPGDGQTSVRAGETKQGETFVLGDKKAVAQETFTVGPIDGKKETAQEIFTIDESKGTVQDASTTGEPKATAQETSTTDDRKTAAQKTFTVAAIDTAGAKAVVQEILTNGGEESARVDKRTIWQRENEEKIKLKDEQEKEAIDQLKASAAKELADWYATYQNERNLRMNNNR